jgi:hypothetical protein
MASSARTRRIFCVAFFCRGWRRAQPRIAKRPGRRITVERRAATASMSTRAIAADRGHPNDRHPSGVGDAHKYGPPRRLSNGGAAGRRTAARGRKRSPHAEGKGQQNVPGRIRTSNLRRRRPKLYPIELRRQKTFHEPSVNAGFANPADRIAHRRKRHPTCNIGSHSAATFSAAEGGIVANPTGDSSRKPTPFRHPQLRRRHRTNNVSANRRGQSARHPATQDPDRNSM